MEPYGFLVSFLTRQQGWGRWCFKHKILYFLAINVSHVHACLHCIPMLRSASKLPRLRQQCLCICIGWNGGVGDKSSHQVEFAAQGTPEAPRCGFSRKVVDALQSAGEKFGTFDILTDEAVRQGIKEVSDWPTFPQVYVR